MRTLAILLMCAAGCVGQSLTPNIGLQIPTYGAGGYASAFQYDLTLLDQLLSGKSPVPAITLQGLSAAPPASPSGDVLWGNSTTGRPSVVLPSGSSYPLALAGSSTYTAGNCVQYDANGNLVQSTGGCLTVQEGLYITNLTGNLGLTLACILASPCPAGLYRVSVYEVTTTAGTGGTVQFTLNWPDGTTTQNATNGFAGTPFNMSLASTTYSSGSTIIQLGGTANPSWTTTVSGATGSPQYSIRVSFERIN